MPQVGERVNQQAQFAKMYAKDTMNKYAQSFKECVDNIRLNERCDLFAEANRSLMYDGVKDALKNFFVEDSYDKDDLTTLEERAEHIKDMESLFENDLQTVQEYAAMSSFNPVLGISFPMHKNIMMNNVFDKGVITKVVANAPKFTLTMETRYMETPDGTEIDMWKEQNKMTAAIDATVPIKKIPLALPENLTTDVLGTYFARTGRHDSLDISTKIVAVLVKSCVRTGEKYIDYTPATPAVVDASGVVTTPMVPAKFDEKLATADHDSDDMQYVWKSANAEFKSYYGEFDRTLTCSYAPIVITKLGSGLLADSLAKTVGVLTGFQKKNKFLLQATGEAVAVLMAARLDTSTAMLPTCSVKWGARTTMEEIGTAIPINTAISPEEVKDIQALYNVNQLTKIMSLMKTALSNYKDDKIKEGLDTSFVTMPDSQKIARCFDFAPRAGYYSDHVEWRLKTFMDALDDYTDLLLQVLRDPNMTITVIGRSTLIKKITPQEYTYQTPSAIGPIDIDYVKTVVSTNKKVWQFVSTDKLIGNDNLIVILNPRNTERIIYRIYDYQFYVSNEIRNAELYTLPSIHAFEKWKFVEYQPVQGRIKILNPSGLLDHTPNLDPIGTTAMTDFDITP